MSLSATEVIAGIDLVAILTASLAAVASLRQRRIGRRLGQFGAADDARAVKQGRRVATAVHS